MAAPRICAVGLPRLLTGRKELGVKGFVAIGGKTAAGKSLYAKAKSLP